MKFSLLPRLLIFSVFLSSKFGLIVWADSGQELGLQEIYPVFMIDHTGFKVPTDYTFSGSDYGRSPVIFPIFPVFEKKLGRLRFAHSVVIPAKYIAESGLPLSLSVELAKKAIREQGYDPIQYPGFDGPIYGIDPSYHRRSFIGYSKKVGISIGVGLPAKKKDVFIGERAIYGFDFDLSGGSQFLGIEKGFNLAEELPIPNFGHFYDLMGQNSAEDLIDLALKFLPLTQDYMAQNQRNSEFISEFQSAGESLSEPEELAKQIPSDDLESKFGSMPEWLFFLLRRKPPLLSTANFNLNITNYSTDSWSQDLPDSAKLYEFNDEYSSLWKELKRKEHGEIELRGKVLGQVYNHLVLGYTETQGFLQQVCDHIAKVFDVPGTIWPRCRISASLFPNAYAYPGGDIFVTAGLMGVLSDLDSLIMVLAHEIGHVVGRHGTKKMSTYDTFNGIANVIGFAGMIYSWGGGLGDFGTVTFGRWLGQTVAASTTVSVGNSLFMLGATSFLASHSRKHEWQSDRLGHHAALMAGARQNAVVSGWNEFMEYVSTMTGVPSDFESRLASHPSGSKREEAIKERYGDLQSVEERFAVNRLPDQMYRYYRENHAVLKGYTDAFLDFYLQLTGRNLEARREHVRKSFFSPGGLCVHYALGGMKH